MNELNVSLATVLDSPTVDDTPVAEPAREFVGPMNELNVSLATVLDSPTVDDTPVAEPAREFVGSSDETIAEAVRRALSQASLSLRTLEGAGVVVIPQIDRHGASPRFHVTLRVSPSAPADGAPASHA